MRSWFSTPSATWGSMFIRTNVLTYFSRYKYTTLLSDHVPKSGILAIYYFPKVDAMKE